MDATLELSIVTETYNLVEGSKVATLRRTLARAVALADERGRGEVLLADVDGRPELDPLLAEFPQVRRIPCAGLPYDAAKNRAVQDARGEFVVFLDGDCVPDDAWLESLLAPLRSGQARATCGFTAYAGGFWAGVQTVMDFGYLLPRTARPVGCYPCNNWATRRADLLERPIPEEALRCSCYPHAQAMARRGEPMWMAPGAAVRHDLPPFWAERLRRGSDLVDVCRVDPQLPESRLLRRALGALPGFYFENVALDWQRLRNGRATVGLSRLQALLAVVLMPALRLIDVVGIARALRVRRA
jgi:glycosyltransferase involved in cell wall biosynthesis